jgi:curved DNA-binding protein CbpA
MAMDDYYRLLDVAPDADREVIRDAYRSRRDALQAQEGDNNKRAKIAQLNRAWNVLSDPTQRERHLPGRVPAGPHVGRPEVPR